MYKKFARRMKILVMLIAIIVLSSSYCQAAEDSRLDIIMARGYILVGSTGDYKPMSYYNKDTAQYEGFDVEME